MAKQIAFVALLTKRARESLQQPKSCPLIARLDLVWAILILKQLLLLEGRSKHICPEC